eukprot:TRINITY_DN64988_c0_g1_i1.p1 TRINITY_DN64988_c0_g1~~TRINITY_DN64988_c0_g1_i1.p1  ORF type:complete len:304 (+),score=59.86 TRINITY_DN64988_c0_g1_i1:64-912(+)
MALVAPSLLRLRPTPPSAASRAAPVLSPAVVTAEAAAGDLRAGQSGFLAAALCIASSLTARRVRPRGSRRGRACWAIDPASCEAPEQATCLPCCAACRAQQRRRDAISAGTAAAVASMLATDSALAEDFNPLDTDVEKMQARSARSMGGEVLRRGGNFLNGFEDCLGMEAKTGKCCECKGNQILNCYRCKGTGQMSEIGDPTKFRDCLECGATGSRVCGFCKGSGLSKANFKKYMREDLFRLVVSRNVKNKMDSEGKAKLKRAVPKVIADIDAKWAKQAQSS